MYIFWALQSLFNLNITFYERLPPKKIFKIKLVM